MYSNYVGQDQRVTTKPNHHLYNDKGKYPNRPFSDDTLPVILALMQVKDSLLPNNIKSDSTHHQSEAVVTQ